MSFCCGEKQPMAVDVDGHEFDELRVVRTKEQTRRYYDRIAQFYDLLAEPSEKPMREKGLDRLGARPGERILEIGFGTGHCLVELARAVGSTGRVLGLDLSGRMVQLAQERVEREGPSERVQISCGDARRMPYAESSLDGVFMSFTLELFDTPDVPTVLAECRRVLSPGGRLAVVGISREGEPGPLTRLYEWTHQYLPALADCRPIHVRRALEEAGFEIRDSRIERMWIPVEIVLGVKRPLSALPGVPGRPIEKDEP